MKKATSPPKKHNNLSCLRMLMLLKDLMENNEHDRHSVVQLLMVKPATADRYLRLLVAHVPGIKKVQRKRGLTIRFDASAVHEAASYPSAVAACLSASLAKLFEGSIYEKTMIEAAQYVLKRTKRKDAFKDINNLTRKFFFVRQGGEVALPEQADHLDELVGYILKQERIAISYQGFLGKTERKAIEPLSLAIYDHQLYILGREADTVHPYRFSRIRKISGTSTSFDYPTINEYNPDQHFADSIGVFLGAEYPIEDIEIYLHPRWSTYANTHRWHRSQRIRREGERVVLQLRVRICPEFIAWVLGFGAEAEVIKPATLRRTIAERAAELVKLYNQTSPPSFRAS